MKDSLLVYLTYNEFEEMAKTASNVDKLYDKYDGEDLLADKNKWTKNYLGLQLVKVIDNFSTDRIEHLKEVVKYVYPPKEI
jgi:hypothetical protein